MGIDVAPPDVNASDRFHARLSRQAAAQVIRFGLAAIKGVGEQGGAGHPLDARGRRAGRSRTSSISASGSTCPRSIARRDRGADQLRGVRHHRRHAQGADESRGRRDQGRPAGPGGRSQGRAVQPLRRQRLGRDEEDHAPALSTEEWSEAEMLAREKAVLGFYVTKHPLAGCADLIEACATASTKSNSTPSWTRPRWWSAGWSPTFAR
jgi:DNA polymerase-3 subunit alpha